MTKEELKKAIISAQALDWFENISLTLDFSSIDLQLQLDGFSSVYIYFQTQLEGWNSLGDKIPQVLKPSFELFNTVFPILNQIVSNAKSYNEKQLNTNWHNVTNAITPNHIRNTFTYNCPETEFLIRVQEEQSDYVDNIYRALIAFAHNESIQLITTKDFTAYLMAYEFIQKDHTNITQRKNAEKASLSKLRNDFQKYLNLSEEQLNKYLIDSRQKSEEYSKNIDKLKETKESEFNTWFTGAKEQHGNFIDETKKHREELENTYRELLRLKEPADYWKLRALKLQTQGRRYMNLLIALVVFSAGLLFFLLGTISNGALEVIFDDAGKAIKWSIVLISFLSFLAYGVRLLAKVSFSAFHLARDAEEREHLTYLYLSLHKDGNVENEDRKLVLQSLFSRADTGLLKDDSSPSMPGSATNIIERVMTKPN